MKATTLLKKDHDTVKKLFRDLAIPRRVLRSLAAGAIEVVGGRDQGRGPAADAVEEGDHLRDRGHFHAPRPGDADHRTDDHPEDDERPVVGDLDPRRDQRDAHPHRGDDVSAPRGLGRAQVAEPKDEADGRKQIA